MKTETKEPKLAEVSANHLDHNFEGLPLPRLQLRWEKTGETWGKRTCFYEIVLPLSKYDIRAEREGRIGRASVLRLRIGETKCESGSDKLPVFDNKVESPFRDGAHALWDSKILNLPVFATCEGQSTKL